MSKPSVYRNIPREACAAGESRADDMTTIKPGERYITGARGEVIVTVLGSCVAACIRDHRLGVGGMNHFMLPHDEEGVWGGASRALRFGNHAMETLINDLLARGADRSRLECKFFGGGNVLAGMNGIGDQNAEFALEYARREHLRVVATDLGGRAGRRVVYHPASGRAWRRFVGESASAQFVRDELRLRKAPVEAVASPSIELF